MHIKLMKLLALLLVIMMLALGVSAAFAAPPLQDAPTETPTAALATTEPLTNTTTTDQVAATPTTEPLVTTEPLTDTSGVTTTTVATPNPTTLPATGGDWPTSLILIITLVALGALLTMAGVIAGRASRGS